MNLTQYLGDTVTHMIPLTWQDSPFSPGEAWNLIFTVKRKPSDPDTGAVFQKASGLGMVASGSNAAVAVLNIDTRNLTPISYHYDIKAQSIADGSVRTVAIGRLKLTQNVLKIPAITQPIHTIENYDPGATLTAANLVSTMEQFTEEQAEDARAALGLTEGIVVLTQAEYDDLTPEQIADPTKFYIIQG